MAWFGGGVLLVAEIGDQRPVSVSLSFIVVRERRREWRRRVRCIIVEPL